MLSRACDLGPVSAQSPSMGVNQLDIVDDVLRDVLGSIVEHWRRGTAGSTSAATEPDRQAGSAKRRSIDVADQLEVVAVNVSKSSLPTWK